MEEADEAEDKSVIFIFLYCRCLTKATTDNFENGSVIGTASFVVWKDGGIVALRTQADVGVAIETFVGNVVKT